MKIIPLSQVRAQTLSTVLNGNVYQLRLLDKGSTGVFLDISAGRTPIALGVLCLDRRRLVQTPYRGFPGDLMFADQRGFTNPVFTGFNDRYLLCWLEPDEMELGL